MEKCRRDNRDSRDRRQDRRQGAAGQARERCRRRITRRPLRRALPVPHLREAPLLPAPLRLRGRGLQREAGETRHRQESQIACSPIKENKFINVSLFKINRKDIEAGEAVSIEDPISAHLSPYKMKSNCCYCFR